MCKLKAGREFQIKNHELKIMQFLIFNLKFLIHMSLPPVGNLSYAGMHIAKKLPGSLHRHYPDQVHWV